MFVQGFMVFYILIKSKQFYFKENDTNVAHEQVLRLDDDENYWDLPFNQMNITIFQRMKF